jgi:hypothetical protein
MLKEGRRKYVSLQRLAKGTRKGALDAEFGAACLHADSLG